MTGGNFGEHIFVKCPPIIFFRRKKRKKRWPKWHLTGVEERERERRNADPLMGSA